MEFWYDQSSITFLFCLEIRKDLTNMYDGKPPRRRYPNYHSSKSKISVNQTNSPQTPGSPLVKKQVTKIISICSRVLLKIVDCKLKFNKRIKDICQKAS